MITSARLVPELQHYFEKYVNGSTLNKSVIPGPASIQEEYLGENISFIRLLFDDNWPVDSTSYEYTYELVDRNSYPWIVQTRLMVYNQFGQYWTIDPTSDENIFYLQSDDIKLLNKLLEYRTDQTCSIYDIVFDDLTTSLSKLVYIYLDLKLNDSYEQYNNPDIISQSGEILASCYEAYIIEQIFESISARGS